MIMLTGDIWRQFSLQIWSSFIGQFVQAGGGDGMGWDKGGGRGGCSYFKQLQVAFY